MKKTLKRFCSISLTALMTISTFFVSETYKAKAISITTGGTSYRTWGCKLTPTLLQFYKHNTNL